MLKPWLFMDLDGVVSPVPPQSRKTRIRRNGPPDGSRTWPSAIYDMYVDERLTHWASELDRVYDVVWASWWGEMLSPVVACLLDFATGRSLEFSRIRAQTVGSTPAS